MSKSGKTGEPAGKISPKPVSKPRLSISGVHEFGEDNMESESNNMFEFTSDIKPELNTFLDAFIAEQDPSELLDLLEEHFSKDELKKTLDEKGISRPDFLAIEFSNPTTYEIIQGMPLDGPETFQVLGKRYIEKYNLSESVAFDAAKLYLNVLQHLNSLGRDFKTAENTSLWVNALDNATAGPTPR
jgi:hypothetical protein